MIKFNIDLLQMKY